MTILKIHTISLSDRSEVYNMSLSGTLHMISEKDAAAVENGLRALIEKHTNDELAVRHLDAGYV